MKSHAEKEGGSVGCEAGRPGGSTRPSEGEGSPPGNTPPEDIHLQLRERCIPVIPALERWRRDGQRLVIIF